MENERASENHVSIADRAEEQHLISWYHDFQVNTGERIEWTNTGKIRGVTDETKKSAALFFVRTRGNAAHMAVRYIFGKE